MCRRVALIIAFLLLPALATPGEAQRLVRSSLAPSAPSVTVRHEPFAFSAHRSEPSFGRHVGIGAAVGAGVGLVVGVLAYQSCPCGGYPIRYDRAVVPGSILLGATGGAMTGMLIYGARRLAR